MFKPRSYEVGGDVVFTTTGSANLTALTFDITVPAVTPGNAAPLANYATGSTSNIDTYSGFSTTPVAFGSAFNPASSGSGAMIAVRSDIDRLGVAEGYISGALIGTSTATYSGSTIASLGLNPGSYVWTWGSGATADSLTLNIVPEPSSFLLGSLALMSLFFRRARDWSKRERTYAPQRVQLSS